MDSEDDEKDIEDRNDDDDEVPDRITMASRSNMLSEMHSLLPADRLSPKFYVISRFSSLRRYYNSP
jgi:hypothetical protein